MPSDKKSTKVEKKEKKKPVIPKPTHVVDGICRECGRKTEVNKDNECFRCFKHGLRMLGYNVK